MKPGSPTLERFSAGERFAVDPNAIERELASLWRAAGASSATRTPVTRACLWNVVVHIEGRPRYEGHGDEAGISKLVRELPQHLASRALVLRTMPDASDAPELESWISANCIIAGGGGKLVCSEEIAIVARGAGEQHLPALVRALLVPAVPTAIVFAGAPPFDRPAMSALLDAADRVVVHCDRSALSHPFKRLADTSIKAALGLIDLGWLEWSTYRRLVASLFDPPSPDEEWQGIERVAVTAPANIRWSALLMLAWMASSLGATRAKALGEGAWRLEREGQAPLELFSKTGGPETLPIIELSARGKAWRISACANGLAEVSGPNFEMKKMLGHPTLAETLSRALRTRSEDRAFQRSLRLAGTL